MHKLMFFLLLLLLPFAPLAAKEKKAAPTPIKTLLKNARVSIKEKKDQSKRLPELEEAAKRADVTNEQLSEIRHTQSLLNLSLNDAENLKAYLKQKYDTVAFFSTLLSASQFALQSDSTDTLPNAKGKQNPKFRSKNLETLLKYRKNLYNGALFHLRKNDYKTALPYLTTYIDMAYAPLLAKDELPYKDTLLMKAKYYASVSAYNTKQPQTALRYIDDVIRGVDVNLQPSLQEYKVRSLLAIADTAKALAAMEWGCLTYPKHNYFFTNLEQHYEDTHQYDKGITLADSMLQHVQDIALYWYAKSLMYLHKEDWEHCIDMCDSTLTRDKTNTKALYNRGISYVNMAAEVAETACYDLTNPKCRRDRQRINMLYQLALPSFRQLRSLLPEDKERWAPMLYRIYLNTNKGQEFEEIEKIMKTLK